jgi:hypothetical protein
MMKVRWCWPRTFAASARPARPWAIVTKRPVAASMPERTADGCSASLRHRARTRQYLLTKKAALNECRILRHATVSLTEQQPVAGLIGRRSGIDPDTEK